jgi:hypothetical protein
VRDAFTGRHERAAAQHPGRTQDDMTDPWGDEEELGFIWPTLREIEVATRRAVVLITVPVWGAWGVLRDSAQKLECFSPERIAAQFTYYRKLCFVCTLLWTILLWSMSIWKFFNSGVSAVIAYFTNVSLLIQAIYYTADLVSYFTDPQRRSLEMWLLYAFWPAVFAQTFIVFVLVIVVYLDNAEIFTENLKCDGGKYDTGVVLFVDRIVHVIPLFIGMVYYALRWHDISDFLIMIYGAIYTQAPGVDADGHALCIHERTGFVMRAAHSWRYIFYQYAVASIPFIVYVLVQNVQTVYGIDIFTNWMGVLATFALDLVCVVLPLYTIIFYYSPMREVPPSLSHYHKPDLTLMTDQVQFIDGPPFIVEATHSRKRIKTV